MTPRRPLSPCGFREEALIAVALDEGDAPLQQAVRSHILQCQACRDILRAYRSVHQAFTRLRDTSGLDSAIQQARATLAYALTQTIRRPLQYCQVTSAFGALAIATSPRGIPLVAWYENAAQLLSSLGVPGEVTTPAHGEDSQRLIAELQAYFTGTRTRFTWPIDDMLVRSDFQRAVLKVTAEIPYGAVMSYQGVAAALGQPKAVRAVAQALRRNPVAIVIPCHRVVGRTGHLTGYAGGLERKRALLAHEGVPLVRRAGALCIDQTHMYVGWRAERAYCRPQCPTLVTLPPGDMLLVSPEAIVAQRHFTPCDVCHPDTVSA